MQYVCKKGLLTMAKNIKLIIGSTRQNRVGAAIAPWIEKHAKAAKVDLEVIDLKQINLPAFDAPVPPAYAPPDTQHGKAWQKQIADADGFIFLTAEYNRSISSSLKNAIDYLAAEWKGKPAAIVSYGYIDGGASATNHLQDIFKWLKLEVIEPTVALQLKTDYFTEDGTFKNIDEALAGGEDTLLQALKQF